MQTIKKLLEEVRAFNLDTDEELDLDALENIDLEQLLGGEYKDDLNDAIEGVDYSDLSSLTLADLADYYDSEDSGDGIDRDDGIDGESEQEELEATAQADNEASTLDDVDPDNAELAQADGIDQDLDDPLSPEEMDKAADGEEENDFQGNIRTVRGANLVFKRKTEDGNFEELWVYNVGNDMKRETQIRRAILSGTDIDPTSQSSKEGEQYAETSSMGNVQFLHIVGLPQ